METLLTIRNAAQRRLEIKAFKGKRPTEVQSKAVAHMIAHHPLKVRPLDLIGKEAKTNATQPLGAFASFGDGASALFEESFSSMQYILSQQQPQQAYQIATFYEELKSFVRTQRSRKTSWKLSMSGTSS